MKISLVIVAGGSGSRMKQPVKKAFLELRGKTLVERTTLAFRGVSAVQEIIVVVPSDVLAEVSGGDTENLALTTDATHPLARALYGAGATRMVVGGPRRQDSVRNGVLATDSTSEVIWVHDAARPFVSVDDLERLQESLRTNRAAILAHPVRDSLKRVADGNIVEPVERDGLWAAQTPQAARRSDLIEAFDAHNQTDVTDEAGLLALAGIPCRVVEGSPLNFKITTPDDLTLAEGVLGRDHDTTVRTRPPSSVYRELSSRHTVLDLTELANQHPGPAQQLEQAMDAHRRGDTKVALQRVEEILATSPDLGVAHRLRSDCLETLEQPEAALVSARHAIELEPEDPHNWVHLGSLLIHEDEVQEEAKAAILIARGLRLRYGGYPDAAKRQFERALSRWPTFAKVVEKLAVAD